ncbi:MAG: SDR family NAD(P)-dependent oxidoreductase [Myxococcales bacterium]|nr:SDR family NAD(P)-dependent oxidoreductase [Myxococcales bacterium]
MRVVFLGATKGMGRALARRMASRGESLFLLGRSEEELAKSAEDLQVHGAGGDVHWAQCDLLDPAGFPKALEAAESAMGGFDTVVVTAGQFASQEELEGNASLAAQVATVNFTNTMVFCESARQRLLEQSGGTLCVFSSVAGERGRKPVIIYGATKAGLSAYLEGLDHKYRQEGLRVVTVKPGFVRTSMTQGLKPPPFAGDPDEVAETVLHAIDRGTPVVYVPAPWKAVMAIIRRLPRSIMRRVKF